MRNQKIIAALVLSLCSTVIFSSVPTVADQKNDPLDDLSPLRVQTLRFYHQLGLSGDRSQIPALINGLQTHTDRDVRKTILLTLVRLHAM